jgi:predicted nucleic acid-binding protein
MSFLLDTNLISESTRAQPDPAVMAWMAAADEDRLFLSVITIAELRHGVARLDDGRRKRALDSWLAEDLPGRFEDRLLPIDEAVANRWGLLVARCQAAGRPIGAMDAFVAATAEHHDLILVTRNVADFEASGVRLLNPWEDASRIRS